MTVLILEDDAIQAAALEKRLFRDLGAEVDAIATELEFRRRLETAEGIKADVAVVDMMLRWTDPSPHMELPPDYIIREGFYTAGLRCCRELRNRNIRCVIFTALDPGKIPLREDEKIPIINKSRGFEPLVQEINEPSCP